MEQSFFELENPASAERPFLDLTRANISYDSHFHREIEVLYVICGRVRLVVNGKEYLLQEQDIFIIMPGEIHSFSSGEENRLYVMKFYSFGELQNQRTEGWIREGDRAYPVFKELIRRIAFEDTQRAPGYLYAINMLSSQLMLEIVRTLGVREKTRQEEKRLHKQAAFLTALDRFLNASYMNPVTLEQAAGACGYSKYHFTRWMRQTVNMNFSDYLSAFRLERAVFLLKNTDKGVTEIALDCGFGTLRSFHRQFQKFYGKTPRELRNQ